MQEVMPEAKVKELFKKMLKRYAPFVTYFMPQSGIYGSRGITDFVLCVKGHYMGVEAKASNKARNLTALQAKHADDVVRAGGTHLVVYNQLTIDAAEVVIRRLL